MLTSYGTLLLICIMDWVLNTCICYIKQYCYVQFEHECVCFSCFQVGKEMLSIKNKEGEGPSFNLLMELLRGDH